MAKRTSWFTKDRSGEIQSERSRGKTRADFVTAFEFGAGASAIAALLSHFQPTPYDNYVLFAQALVRGHLWINWPGPTIDAVLVNGHRYIVNDPLPGLMLVPFVAVFGTANQTMLDAVLCGVATGAAWELCRRFGCSVKTAAWLTAFMFAGTQLLWCSVYGDVWFVAQTSCTAMVLLSLCELMGKNRPWLVALLYCAAIGSRFTLVMALPVIAWLMWRDKRHGAGQFVATLLPFFALWVWYNIARWGVPWDAGHTIFYHQDAAAGSLTGSPFSLTHIPYELESFFAQAPKLLSGYPWLRPTLSGVALTWVSPALVLAAFARRPRPLVLAFWAATLLVAGPSLLYYVNGYVQFGMRHALDFEPFLLALMIFAVRDRFTLWSKALISYSIAASSWGCWYWLTFVRNS